MLRVLIAATRVAGLTYSLLSSCVLIGALGYGVYKAVQSKKATG